MTVKDNGKKIAKIWLPGEGHTFNDCVITGVHGNLELSATYHGDRDEFWVVNKGTDGVEKERFNCRSISKIEWL